MNILPYGLLITILISCADQPSKNDKSSETESSKPTSENVQTKNETFSDTVHTTLHSEPLKNNTDLFKLGLFGKISEVHIYSSEVDEDGQIMGMGGYSTEITFDQFGNISNSSVQGCCGMDGSYFIYEYNDNNQLVRLYSFIEPLDPKNIDKHNFDYKEKFFYKNGILAKSKKVNSDTTLIKEHEYDYDEKGQLINEQILNPIKENLIEITYSYDENRVTKSIFENNELDYQHIFELNEKGDTLQEEMISTDFHLTKMFEYQFDAASNWIEKIETSFYKSSPDNKTFIKTERKLTYH